MQDRYFIPQYIHLSYQHGGVGYSDMEKILLADGCKPLLAAGNGGSTGRVKRLLSILRLAFSLQRDTVVIFIFPVYARRISFLPRILAFRGIRCPCIVGDIDGVKDGDPALLAKDLRFLRNFSDFIVHNPVMEEWLRSRVEVKNISSLGYFDFKVETIPHARQNSGPVVFAGNLGKSGFIARLDDPAFSSLQFNFYGPGMPAGLETVPNLIYKGVYAPNQLVSVLEGSYGLVWDGDSATAPAGSLGEYMKLITQHKLSLYIVAGLPIIIHPSAACAETILQQGIGITCADLRGLPAILANIPEGQYRQMQERMQPLAIRISQGRNLMDALKKINH